MNTWFRIEINVKGYAAKNKDKIIAAARAKGYSESPDLCKGPRMLHFSGEEENTESSLDPDLDKRLNAVCAAVWQANGGYCKLKVNVFYVEEDQLDDYQLTKRDYTKLVVEKTKRRNQ